jgi:hypothetical protein
MILSTGCDAVRPLLRAVQRPSRCAATALLAAIVFGSSEARAQTAPTQPDPGQQAGKDPVAAEALFKAGRDFIKKGDYAAGCPKFEASLRLNPSASTMLNIAKCHEHEGKLATAWASYNRARTLNDETKGAERRRELDEVALKGIAALEPRLPRLRVVLVRSPPGLKVTRGDKEILPEALGEAIPADPGRYEVSASAPGYKTVKRSAILEEGKTETIEIELEADTPSPQPKPQGGVPVWAWVAGGAGIALVGAGVYFLVDDLSAISDLRASCVTSWSGTYCAPGYDYASDNARKDRDFGLFLGFTGAGILALGAATYGIVTAPRAGPSEPAKAGATVIPWVGREGAGATLSGRF